jgi:DNA-binding protein HU-beta
MTKTEFITDLCLNRSELLMSKAQVAAAVDAVLETIERTLHAGEDITFTGFGSFKVTDRAQRMGRNPRTGKGIVVPPRKAVKFVPGTRLREAVK